MVAKRKKREGKARKRGTVGSLAVLGRIGSESRSLRKKAQESRAERKRISAMRLNPGHLFVQSDLLDRQDLLDLYVNAPVGYFTLARDGRILRLNLTAARLFGHQERSLLRASLPALAATGSKVLLSDHLERTFITEKPQTCRLYLHRYPSGDFYAQLSSIRYGGTIRTVVADISDLRDSDERLIEAQTRFNMVMRATEDFFWDWDLATGRVWRSENIRRLGYSPEEFNSGRAWWENNIHPDDREKTCESLQSAIENRASSWSAEYRFLCRGGPPIHALDRAYLIFDPKGTPIRLIGTMMDHTLYKEAEATIKATAEQFRNLLETAPDAVVITDEAGRMVLLNGQTEEIFGYRREELLGNSIEILLPERFRGRRLADQVKEEPGLGPAGSGKGMELFGLRKDGSEFAIEVRVSAYHSRVGLLVTQVFRDITRRKALEKELLSKAEALARSNEELESFAYVASHDLKEPLRMVRAYVELLRRKYQDRIDAQANEYIGFAVEGAKRLSKLVDDLLEYSRLGGRKIVLKPSDLNAALQVAMINLEASIKETQAEIVTSPLPQLLADFDQIVRLFQNLISNSIKFRGENRPCIEIAATKEKEAWRFSVKDNGVGFEESFAKEIFGLFRRLQGVGIPGSGIGLAASKKIVEAHGGKIWAESKPGKGATFFFTIPQAPEER